MNSPRVRIHAVMVAALFGALLLFFGVSHAGHATADEKEVYPKLKIFTEVLSLVDQNYVEDPDNQDLIDGAIRGMLTSLDPHSSYMTKEQFGEMQVDTRGEFGGLGIQIGIRDGALTVIAPIEDTPAARAGIMAGDRIDKIEGESAQGISLHDAVKKLRGPKGSPVTITIYRESTTESLDVTIIRDIIAVKSVKHKVIEDTVGYVRITQFQERTAEDLQEALEGFSSKSLTGLILDLRNNPGGLLNSAIDVADQFIPKDSVVVYTLNREGTKTEFRTGGKYTVRKWPLVILVNSGSASASEIVAGAVKDLNRGVVLGTQTFGKGSVQTVISLSDGSGMRLTTSRYYTPSGLSIQGTGIEPTIKVELAATNGQKAHKVIRERDLEGHLMNEQAEEGETLTDEEVMPFQIEEKDDTQLHRAVDLLKSWSVMKQG